MAKRTAVIPAASIAVAAAAASDEGSLVVSGNASSPPDGTPPAPISDAPAAVTETAAGSPAAAVNLAGADAMQGNDEGAKIDEDEIGDLAGRVIMVRSVSDRGRRRAGRAFGPVPVPVRVDDLSDDQLGSLMADPQLVVSLDD
jgi:hypothetical protein